MKIPRFLPRFKGFHIPAKIVIVILTFNWANAITLFPFVFYRNKYVMTNQVTKNHEIIHIHQQMEVGLVAVVLYVVLSLLIQSWYYTLPILPLYYWMYLSMWVMNLFLYGKRSYKEIPFEREAYDKSNIMNYHVLRRPFAWREYMYS